MTRVNPGRRQVIKAAAAAAGLGLVPSIALAQKRISIVTGGTGGVFYPYGGGLAKLLSDKAPGIQATAQVTGGSVDNNKLIGAGDAEIGFTTLDSAFDALEGKAAYADVGPQNIAVLAVLYNSFLHAVARSNRGITNVAGLRGRRVSVGSAGSSTESIADRVLAAAGLNPQTDVTRDNLGVGESVGALKDGKVEAFFWIGGVPTAAVRDLASTDAASITFLQTDVELAKLQSDFPNLYQPFNLEPNSYNGQTTLVKGLGVPNVLVVSGEADEAMVTEVLTTMFDHLDTLKEVHPEARKLSLQGAATPTAVPFHPAATAFFRSRGVSP